MVKYAGSDTSAETAGTASPEGMRFSVLRMARLLAVSTSGYYAWRKRAAATELTPRQQRRADLAAHVHQAGGDPGVAGGHAGGGRHDRRHHQHARPRPHGQRGKQEVTGVRRGRWW